MHFAASGAEALDRLAEEIQPALAAVLSDINMPGMDGLELLGEIKQRRPDLPVMMVTAYGDDERRRRAAALGAVEFITKPVDFDQLKEQLHQLSLQRISRGSFRLASSQPQAGQQKLAVLRLSIGDDAWYHNRGDLSQPLYDLSRFVQSPHMGVGRRKEPVTNRNDGSLLQRCHQDRRSVLETSTEKVRAAHRDAGVYSTSITRVQPHRSLEMLNCKIGLTRQ
jgi:CheY-like chemotaxis protein